MSSVKGLYDFTFHLVTAASTWAACACSTVSEGCKARTAPISLRKLSMQFVLSDAGCTKAYMVITTTTRPQTTQRQGNLLVGTLDVLGHLHLLRKAPYHNRVTLCGSCQPNYIGRILFGIVQMIPGAHQSCRVEAVLKLFCLSIEERQHRYKPLNVLKAKGW
jgi:hypothetical protein